MFRDAPLVRWAMRHCGARSWRTVMRDARAGHLTPAEQRVIDFNERHGVRAGYAISFPRSSPRSGYGIGLGSTRLTQDEVDAIWRDHGDMLELLASTCHLKFISLPHGRAVERLTSRQREVLELVADGKTIQDVASIIGRSSATVEKHLRLARDVLDVDTDGAGDPEGVRAEPVLPVRRGRLGHSLTESKDFRTFADPPGVARSGCLECEWPASQGTNRRNGTALVRSPFRRTDEVRIGSSASYSSGSLESSSAPSHPGACRSAWGGAGIVRNPPPFVSEQRCRTVRVARNGVPARLFAPTPSCGCGMWAGLLVRRHDTSRHRSVRRPPRGNHGPPSSRDRLRHRAMGRRLGDRRGAPRRRRRLDRPAQLIPARREIPAAAPHIG